MSVSTFGNLTLFTEMVSRAAISSLHYSVILLLFDNCYLELIWIHNNFIWSLLRRSTYFFLRFWKSSKKVLAREMAFRLSRLRTSNLSKFNNQSLAKNIIHNRVKMLDNSWRLNLKRVVGVGFHYFHNKAKKRK